MTSRYGALVHDRLVWIDCEMTGLDLSNDALIEVAALVTDFELNVLGDGIDVIVKPPPRRWTRWTSSCATCTTPRACSSELDDGSTLEDAEQQVLGYIKEHCPDGSRPPLAGNTVATDRAFLARDMAELESFLHYRIVDVSSIKELSRRWYPRAPTTARPRRAGTTARSPTSRRASRSSATTGRPCSCRSPGPTRRRRRRWRWSTAAPSRAFRSPGRSARSRGPPVSPAGPTRPRHEPLH